MVRLLMLFGLKRRYREVACESRARAAKVLSSERDYSLGGQQASPGCPKARRTRDLRRGASDPSGVPQGLDLVEELLP